MTSKEYANKHYPHLPTYNKIAVDAFNAGLESAKPKNVIKLEKELKRVKSELKSLWNTIEDPEKFVELIYGM